MLSTESRQAQSAPRMGKGDSVLKFLLLIVKLLLSIKKRMDRIRVDDKGHDLLGELTPTPTLALCRRVQVLLIDSRMSWPGPGDSTHCHTGAWTAGAAPGYLGRGAQ